MFSLLPGIVSLLFLAYGAYVLHSRGVNRISLTFFLLCTTTFFWQSCWAVLFQLQDRDEAYAIVKLGYLLILFLPTTLYHFITELTVRQAERRWVALSYLAAAGLAALLLGSELVVDGMYRYFFGFYPRAGLLHPLHVLQTTIVVLRGLYLLYRRQQIALSTEKTRLRYCLLSMAIYFFAAVDYLCNYGLEFYPPGVVFIAVSLGLMAQAMVRHQLLADPIEVAATIAHEMRTPLATMRNQSRVLAHSLPDLLAGYEAAVAHQLHQPTLAPRQLDYLASLAGQIDSEINRSSFIVDMMLASARAGALERHDFAMHSVRKCVEEALARYPFDAHTRAKVRLREGADFSFFGSDVLLVYVLYNLFKNALHAIAQAGQGEVDIEIVASAAGGQLRVTDTGAGIAADVLPHVFDPFYSTRPGGGTGIGLAFCQRVLTAFGGKIECESEPGRFTRFALLFPA